jgi:hypothetical protein
LFAFGPGDAGAEPIHGLVSSGGGSVNRDCLAGAGLQATGQNRAQDQPGKRNRAMTEVWVHTGNLNA